MPFTSEDNRSKRYTGNGSTTAFSWPNQLRATGDLNVYLYTVADGVEVAQTEVTHYTIALAADKSSATVNFVTAPTTAYEVVLEYGTALTNAIDHQNYDGTPAEIMNETDDRSATRDLTLQRQLDIAVKSQPSQDFDGTIPNMFGKDAYAIVVNDDNDGTFSLALEQVASDAVSGPAAGGSTDNAVVRWDAATGRLLQNSGVIIDDLDNVTGVGTLAAGNTTITGTVTASSTIIASAAATVGTTLTVGTSLALATGATVTGIDTTLTADLDTLLVTQKAVKAYVDTQIAANDKLQEIYDNDTSVPQITPTTAGSVPFTIEAAEAVDDTAIQFQVRDSAQAVTFSVLGDGDVDINGGTIDGTVIGNETSAAGNFTTLGASGLATFSNNVTLDSATGILELTGDGAGSKVELKNNFGKLELETFQGTTGTAVTVNDASGAIFNIGNATQHSVFVTNNMANADLGTTAFRWGVLYGASIDVTGDITLTSATPVIGTDTLGDTLELQADAGVTNLTLSGSSPLATFAGDITVNGTDVLVTNATNPRFQAIDTTNTCAIELRAINTQGRVGTTSAHDLEIRAHSALCITLDSTQGATFAGGVDVGGDLTLGASGVNKTRIQHVPLAGVSLAAGGGTTPTRATWTVQANRLVEVIDFVTADFGDVGVCVPLPEDYDGSAITVDMMWSASAGAGDVRWLIQMESFEADQLMNVAYSGSSAINTTMTALTDLHISSLSRTPTSGAGDFLTVKVRRDGTNVADTHSGTARLLGIRLRYT